MKEVDKAIGQYQKYNTQLGELLKRRRSGEVSAELDASITIALNGGAAQAARAHIAVDQRRGEGIFFSDHKLATLVARRASKSIQAGARVLDPACGAGDLLVACALQMGIQPTLSATIERWSSRLVGRDVHTPFVDASRLRLHLLAMQMHPQEASDISVADTRRFQRISVGDGAKTSALMGQDDCIVVNPPYGHVVLDRSRSWADGRTQRAAVFMDDLIESAVNGQRIVAVLPDVLRSGSRYKKWRAQIGSKLSELSVQVLGQFDRWTDVDVFLLTGVCGNASSAKFYWGRTARPSKSKQTVADLFDLSVGPVVPFRLSGLGAWHPYLMPHDVTSRRVRIDELGKIRFDGCAVKPPFVVIKRTSRPGHAYRAYSATVSGSRSVAVENHLIIARPKDGLKKTCDTLVSHLRSDAANRWLDQRIRCRHLTVGAIGALPVESAP